MDYADLRDMAFKFAQKKSFSAYADDFAQEFIMKCFLAQKVLNLNWVYVDFLRKEFGREKENCPSHRHKFNKNIISLELVSDTLKYETHSDQYIDMFEFSKRLKGKQKIVFDTIYLDNGRPQDVVDMLKVNKSRVNHIKKDLHKILREWVTK